MKLSVIIPNRNDLVMLNVTLNSAIESLKYLAYDYEIIICDNSDKEFYNLIPSVVPSGFKSKYNVKLIHQDQPCLSSSFDSGVRESKGEYIIQVDSHVMFGHNTLKDAVNFMDRSKDNPMLGFGHLPIRWAHQGPAGIRHTLTPDPNGTAWGVWDKSFIKDSKMFWKWMPWICRRDWYLNTLRGYGSHSTFNISWGGAGMLQQVKSLMLGYENWAIATDPIIHIGPYTPEVGKLDGYKYRVYLSNGNYPHGFGSILAFAVLGGPINGLSHAKLCKHKFIEKHNIDVEEYWAEAMDLAEPEHNWLLSNQKYSYLELLETRPWESND